MKKHFKLIIGMLFIFAISVNTLFADDYKRMNLKYSSTWGPDMSWHFIDKPVWDKISSMTNKQIKVTPHFMSSLFPPDKCWDSTVMGISDVTLGFVGFDAPGRFPIADLFAIPRLDHRSGSMASMGYEMLQKWPETKKEFKGAKALWINALSYLWFGTTKKPVLSVEDFKGLKIAAPSRWQGKVMASLGIIPVPIPFPDLYVALQKGVIDGMLVDPTLLVEYKIGEVVKHVTDINMGAGTSYGAMNLRSWKKLPSDVKKVIEEMYFRPDRMFEIDAKLISNHYKTMMVSQKKYGIKYYDFPPAEMAKAVKIVQPVRDEYAAFLDKKGYNGKAIIAKFDKLNSRSQL